MRRLIALLILLILLGGAGYYVYRNGWRLPGWVGSSASASDLATTGKVKAALGLSKRVTASDIAVSTESGVVTLTGQVESEDVKSLAGEIARDTEGVKEVRNELAVNPGAQPTSVNVLVDDLSIQAAILKEFAQSAELSGKKIDVKVENRVVTLSGTVDTPAQRNGAEQTARAVDGVAGVTNNLGVANPQAATEPPATTNPAGDQGFDLAKRVEFELYRSGAFETKNMTIRASEGAITLSGNVRSRAEQLLAERIAQGTPGVQKVINELKVIAAPARR